MTRPALLVALMLAVACPAVAEDAALPDAKAEAEAGDEGLAGFAVGLLRRVIGTGEADADPQASDAPGADVAEAAPQPKTLRGGKAGQWKAAK